MKRSLIPITIALALFSAAPVHGVEKVKFSPHTFTLPDGYALKQVAALNNQFQ